jgi:hypothetical protein
MPSAGRPAGPGTTRNRRRDAADEREEIDETLSSRQDETPPDAEAGPTGDQPPSRPQGGGDAAPGGPVPTPGGQTGRRSN